MDMELNAGLSVELTIFIEKSKYNEYETFYEAVKAHLIIIIIIVNNRLLYRNAPQLGTQILNIIVLI